MSQNNVAKRPWGPITQVAYVVDDLDAAIDYWTGVMGVGPFFLIERPLLENGYYENAPLVMNMTAAMAFSGDLQIELILQHDDTPSIFTQRRPKDNGVHHLAAFTEDIDAAVVYLEARGGRRLQGGDVGGVNRMVYMDTGTPAGILEFAQVSPEVQQLFDAIRAAGAAWDGKQRIMTL